VPDDGATWFEHHRDAGASELGKNRCRIFDGGNHRPTLVGDPESSAEVHVFERHAVITQLDGERDERRCRAT